MENKRFTRVSRYTLNSVKRTESRTEAVKLIVKYRFSGRVTQAVFSALSESRPGLRGGTRLLPTPVRNRKGKKIRNAMAVSVLKSDLKKRKKESGLALHLIFHRLLPFNCCLSLVFCP